MPRKKLRSAAAKRSARGSAATDSRSGRSNASGPWFSSCALGETIDRASTAAAGKVCRDGFLASRDAYELLIPQVPLNEIYDRRMADWFREHGVAVHLAPGSARSRVVCRAEALVLARRWRRELSITSWRRCPGAVRALFPDPMLQALPGLSGIDRIQPAPITAVHLWFDRPIAAIPHAVLISRLGQWLFNKNGSVAAAANSPEHYYQVVISASHGLRGRDPKEVAEQVCGELRSIWPAAQKARLIRWRLVTEPEAVFSVQPGLDSCAPINARRSRTSSWPATGPRPVGPPPWKARAQRLSGRRMPARRSWKAAAGTHSRSTASGARAADAARGIDQMSVS